jgi:alpha-tubulin suppressor-like RCC1 family protein
MSTINAANLELQLVQKISSITTELELLALSVALRQLQNGAVFVVQNFADLPSASTSVGELYYVITDSRLYTSYSGLDWQLLATDTAGVLYSWGSNTNGQLGSGTIIARSSPGIQSGLAIWCQASAGHTQAAAVKTDGTLWTWGCNTSGQLGTGNVTARCSPGTTVGCGTTWCQVSAGCTHTAGVKTDGTLWTWGSNTCGRLGDGTVTARSSPGTTAGGGNTWCQISVAKDHNVAVKTDCTLWTWGLNSTCQLGDGTVTPRSSPGTTVGGGGTWCCASTNNLHTAAVKTDGTVWSWGLNSSGQLGDLTVTNKSSPVQTSTGDTTWCKISAGFAHTMATKTDGTLWTWGSNSTGQLGTGTVTSRSSPGQVTGTNSLWCQISAGCAHNTGVKTDGSLWTWGCNSYGQLGDGSIIAKSSPITPTGGICGWCQAAAGAGGFVFTLGIRQITF